MSLGEGYVVLITTLLVYGVFWGLPMLLLVLIYRKLSRIEQLVSRE